MEPILDNGPVVAVPIIAPTPPVDTAAPAAALVLAPVPSSPASIPVDAASTELDAARAELAYYRREAAAGELRVKAAAHQRQLENEGWPPELAAINAKTWFDKEIAEARLAAADEMSESNAKIMVAQRLAAHYGLSADVLMGYATAPAMVTAAKRLGSDAKRLATLEAEIAALKGGAAPTQRFDAGGGAAPGGTNGYRDLLKSGGKLPSASEIDRMTAKYLQG